MIEVDIYKKVNSSQLTFELKVNTKFQSQGITQILGPSGIGKTTLLKIIAGLITPDSGKITVGNKIWYDSEAKYTKKIQERKVGFVFQDYALFPNMNVEQHLKYGTEDHSYIQQLIEIGELENFKKSYPKHLSGGQQQRLAILRALSTKPDLLLMDEPFSALDQQLKTRLIEKLKKLFEKQKTTLLIVTHAGNELNGPNSLLFELK